MLTAIRNQVRIGGLLDSLLMQCEDVLSLLEDTAPLGDTPLSERLQLLKLSDAPTAVQALVDGWLEHPNPKPDSVSGNEPLIEVEIVMA